VVEGSGLEITRTGRVGRDQTRSRDEIPAGFDRNNPTIVLKFTRERRLVKYKDRLGS